MATRERWEQAQAYEAGFWEGVAGQAANNSLQRLDFYEWRAGQLVERLRALGKGRLVSGEARILELGSGPIGVVGYLPGKARVAVDPLDGFYASNPHLAAHRRADVTYVEAGGEDVPLESEAWDLVIMENCIDHTQDPAAVMREIRRLLAPDGTLYLTVNGRSRLGYYMHRLLAKMALDPGHPHTFTVSRFRRFLEAHGFEISWFDAESLARAWIGDLRGPGLRPRAKALLGVSEHLLSAIAEPRAGGAN